MTTKYQPNAANQYAKIAHGTEVVEPEYDPQGNLLHDATRKYTWDADIHLMSVTTEGHREPQRSEGKGTADAAARGATGSVANGQASGLPHLAPHNAHDEPPSKTTTTRFLYDALHRRLGRIKDNGETTVFVYEGWNVIAEKTHPKADARDTENSNLETRHVWGEDLSGTLQGAGGIGGLLRTSVTKTRSNGTRKTEHEHTFSYDSNGNVILLTDTQGRESARYAYDAFGKTLTATGPAAQMNRYRFSTKPVEAESGLVYYGYRYYDPVAGRWPSRDPIRELGGINLYRITKNDAVSRTDKLGLSDSGAQRCADCNSVFLANNPTQIWRPRVCCGGQMHDYFDNMAPNISPPTNLSLYGSAYFPPGECCGDNQHESGVWIKGAELYGQTKCCREGQAIPTITLAQALNLSLLDCAPTLSGINLAESGLLILSGTRYGGPAGAWGSGGASVLQNVAAAVVCSMKVCAFPGELEARLVELMNGGN